VKAVILLSGGLDSSTVLYQAKADGCDCYAISFDYQQRHRRELDAARSIAQLAGVAEHRVVNFDLTLWGGSALTDNALDLPGDRTLAEMSANIPITYVPARNTIFLSFALAYAEAIAAERVYIGVNALDYSGYPDCRPDYIAAMEEVFRLGTKQGREGKAIEIVAPLLHLKKPKSSNWAIDWASLGRKLGLATLAEKCRVGFAMLVSCDRRHLPNWAGKIPSLELRINRTYATPPYVGCVSGVTHPHPHEYRGCVSPVKLRRFKL